MPELRPGTTLSRMIQEDDVVEDMRRVLADRLTLEKKYVSDLRRIRDSINSKYQETSVNALIEPLIGFFDEEIRLKESKFESLDERLTLSSESSPNEPSKVGPIPSILYEALEAPHQNASNLRQEASTGESILSQQTWYRSNHDILETNPWNGDFHLPNHDREYRASVSDQHEAVANALSFHNVELPVGQLVSWMDVNSDFCLYRLDVHQSKLEATQSLILTFISGLSHLSTNIVQISSSALHNVGLFSPSRRCVAAHYEAIEKETYSPLLQRSRYSNFWLGGIESAPPIIGTNGEKESRLIGYLLNRLEYSDWWDRRSTSLLDTLATFEDICSDDSELVTVANNLSGPDRCGILALALMNRPPLLRIDEKMISEFKSGIPRKKIEPLIPAGGYSLQTLQMVAYHAKIPPWIMVTLLTHRTDAANLVTDILCKWDFKRACPYPEGVARRMDPARNGFSEPIYTRNNRPFEQPEKVEQRLIII